MWVDFDVAQCMMDNLGSTPSMDTLNSCNSRLISAPIAHAITVLALINLCFSAPARADTILLTVPGQTLPQQSGTPPLSASATRDSAGVIGSASGNVTQGVISAASVANIGSPSFFASGGASAQVQQSDIL